MINAAVGVHKRVSMNLVIFGAQGYAFSTYEALKTINPTRPVSCFIVSSLGNNSGVLGGLPVVELQKIPAEEKNNMEVLIATPESIQAQIEEILEEAGFRNHSRVDSERWSELMKLYQIKTGNLLPIEALPVGSTRPSVSIYVAKSHKDSPLKTEQAFLDYELPIQVGADNCDVVIADVTDNYGESISKKNVNYSELTGLYWIWRNKLSDTENEDDIEYYGLSQYRRKLSLTEDDLYRLVNNDVDVVLPYPLFYDPDANAHHKRWVKEADWKAVVDALNELKPDYADCLNKVMSQKYLYNYNIILAKKDVLKGYCEWLFPLLERIEELSEPKGSERADRYIGYIAETLETLYFMKHAEDLNIVHTGCRQLT